MARLADAADYTAGALYRYFPSKDALVAALVAQVIQRLAVRIDNNRERFDLPLHRVVAAAWSYREFAAERPHEFALIASLLAAGDRQIPEDDDVRPVITAMTDALRPIGEELLAAQQAGWLSRGDMIERALVLFSMLQGALQLHKQEQIAAGVVDVERIAMAGTRAVLIGWGADATALDRAFEDVRGSGEGK